MQGLKMFGSHQLVANLSTSDSQSVKIAFVPILGRGDRVVDGSSLENCRRETYREFESRPLRQRK